MVDPAVPRDPDAAARLADALMKVSVLDDLVVRRLCVRDAMERLRMRLSVPESDEKKIHLVQMVRAFGAVPDGWRHLTDVVRHLADYDLPSTDAASYAAAVVRPVLAEPAKQELIGLLAGLDRTTVPELSSIYQDVAGEHFGPLPSGVQTAWEAHQLLAHTNRPAQGAPRPVRFLQELATVLTPERGDPIRIWVNRQVRGAADDERAAQHILDDSRRRTGRWREKPREPAYLLIRLFPSSGAPEQVHVTCWTNTGSAWEPRRRDDQSVSSAEVRRHVAALVDREEARLRTHRGGVVLEFILPLSMINTPVQEWSRLGALEDELWDGDLGGPLFWQDYTVVVRSMERIEAQQLHRVWNERWEVLAAEGTEARAHRCRPGDGARKQQLYTGLKQDPAVVLLELGSPPDGEHGRSELVTGLRAGLPVFLWHHSGSLADHAHAVLDGALQGRVTECLDHVTRLRFTPGRGDDGYEIFDGSRIAILWDDPNRLPEVPEPALRTSPGTATSQLG